MTTTWILVANASNARLYQTPKAKLLNGSAALALVREFDHPDSRKKAGDLVADKSGNFNNRVVGQGTFGEVTHPKRQEQDNFARELAKLLCDGQHRHSYDDLILVAPPQFHGLLHRYLNGSVEGLISLDIEKDYTSANESNLVQRLQQFV